LACSTNQRVGDATSTRADFEFMERIGRGASGVVYKARRKADGRVYCVKEIDLSVGQTEEFDYAFQEVISHPGFSAKFEIATAFDVVFCSTLLIPRAWHGPKFRYNYSHHLIIHTSSATTIHLSTTRQAYSLY
jgi:serine/threonine protein kinase